MRETELAQQAVTFTELFSIDLPHVAGGVSRASGALATAAVHVHVPPAAECLASAHCDRDVHARPP